MPRFSLSVRMQVGLLGILGVLGVLLTGGLHLADKSRTEALQSAADHATEVRRLTSSIDTGLLQARRAEKDFLLRLDERYAKRHGDVLKTVETELATLDTELGAVAGS